MASTSDVATRGCTGDTTSPERGLRRRRLVVALLLLLGFSLQIASVMKLSPTYDEGGHLRYGLNILNLDSTRFDDSKMPISALNALPLKLWQIARGTTRLEETLAVLNTARVVTMLFSSLLAFLVYTWSRELYGPAAGVFSLVLYVLEPNIIAHSQLVTTDLYAMLACTLAVYLYWRFTMAPSRRNAFATFVILGVSQLTKYTCIFLFPIVAVLAVLRAFTRRATHEPKPLAKRLASYLALAAASTGVILLIVNLGFLLNGSFSPLSGFHFQSQVFRTIQSKLGVLRDVPVPLPYPYLEGLDMVKYFEETGVALAPVYLFGHLTQPGHGITGYYFCLLSRICG